MGLRQAIIKKGTIGESGQGIVQRQVKELGRENPLFSDVAFENDEIDRAFATVTAPDREITVAPDQPGFRITCALSSRETGRYDGAAAPTFGRSGQ